MKVLVVTLLVCSFLSGVWFIYKSDINTNTSATAEFGGVKLEIEYALTEAERELGLGGRKSVPEGYGMLFVFQHSDRYGFWMKDTLVPLDIYWLDSQGHVVSMALDVATSTYPNVFYPSTPAKYVLETAAGFGALHHIATSSMLYLQSWPTVLH